MSEKSLVLFDRQLHVMAELLEALPSELQDKAFRQLEQLNDHAALYRDNMKLGVQLAIEHRNQALDKLDSVMDTLRDFEKEALRAKMPELKAALKLIRESIEAQA